MRRMKHGARCWLVRCMALVACNARPKAAGPGTKAAVPGTTERALPAHGLEIGYRISAARPRMDFALSIAPSGDAELVLLVPLAEARGPLGRFRGPISAETRGELERYVREHR